MPSDAQPSAISLLKQLFNFIKPRRRMQFDLLILLSIVTSFSEVISLGAVVPFLAVLSDPSRVFSHPAGQSAARFFGITEASGLLLTLTLGFIISALLSGTLRLILLWITTRLSVASGAELSYDIYHRSLYQPYSVHIHQNSSDIISGITQKADSAIRTIMVTMEGISAHSAFRSPRLITSVSVRQQNRLR